MITKEVTNLTYPQIGDATSHHLPARDTVEQASPWERLALGSGIVAARYTWRGWVTFRWRDREVLFGLGCLVAVGALITLQRAFCR